MFCVYNDISVAMFMCVCIDYCIWSVFEVEIVVQTAYHRSNGIVNTYTSFAHSTSLIQLLHSFRYIRNKIISLTFLIWPFFFQPFLFSLLFFLSLFSFNSIQNRNLSIDKHANKFQEKISIQNKIYYVWEQRHFSMPTSLCMCADDR